MTQRIVFLDTETTSLAPDRRAWEVALITRKPGLDDEALRWFVRAADLNLADADPQSLAVGRFYARHPDYAGIATSENQYERDVLRQVEVQTRGAHLVGINPWFDADVIGTRMRACGILPSWDYHMTDINALVAGWAHGVASHLETTFPSLSSSPRPAEAAAVVRHAETLRNAAAPKRDRETLWEALGLKPLPEGERHTAPGDARLARDAYDLVTGS